MVKANTNQPVVEAAGLTKVFRDFWMRTKARAVDNIDFEIYPNEIFGLLGPNGSGKSTTIKMMLGLLHKTKGRLLVFGRQPSDVLIKKRIGFLPEESYLYRYLNPRETLDYYGKLFGLDSRTRKRRTDELLEMVGLTQVAHRAIGEFSKGMTRRIGIAQALINDPDLLVLDEPTSGLDPIGTRQVKDLILDLGRRGKTILLSSHLLADVEDVCDRMVILYGGKIRAEGTAEELLADTESTVIQTPRLQPETISRIEHVIEESEGKAIDKVTAPRQRLEQLFMELVEKAQQEQVTTSGALHTGDTAAFLKDGDPVETSEGDQLIDSLTRERASESRAEEIDMSQRAIAAQEDERDEVLEQLIGSDEPEQAAAVEVVEDVDVSAPDDVDASMIDSLLSGDTSTDSDSDEPKRAGGN